MASRIKKIVILSGKGGVGKSMIASSLALLFAKKKKITAVDCDVDAPNLAIWLGFPIEREKKKILKKIPIIASAKPKIDLKKCNSCGLCIKNCRFKALRILKGRPVLNPFLCEGCGVCEIVCSQKAVKLKPVQNGEMIIVATKYGFPLITGILFPGETGSGKVITEIKKEADRYKAEIQILDSSPGTGCPVIAALQDSNFAVLVTEPTVSGFSDLKRVLEVINHFRVPYRIIVNKWDINIEIAKEIKKWAGKRFLGSISYDKRIFKAVANLTPILETNLRAKKEIVKIFKKLTFIL